MEPIKISPNCPFFMKSPLTFLFALFLALALEARSQTINWGSEVFSDLVDSKGNTLDDTFIFELGAFVNGFLPDDTNVIGWKDNWQAFDRADYNGIESPVDDGIYGYFTSTVSMTAGGLSDSSEMTPGAISFEGLHAYFWIRNSDDATTNSEWLLARNSAWVFPVLSEGCCDKGLPIEWSTSDLTMSDIPVWGAQENQTGHGLITSPGSFGLQSATFTEAMIVPEPSVFFFKALAAITFVLRRRRNP